MARGLILFEMRILLTALFLALPLGAYAQDQSQDDGNDGRVIIEIPRTDALPPPEPLKLPDQPALETDEADEPEAGEIEGEDLLAEDVVPENLAPDYSKLSPSAERTARLDDLFVKLAKREDEESANLIAEEIVAIWMESGSASVNLLLRRGSDAAAKGNPKLARKMYNHAVDLAPDFVEVWSRSARLALTQKDYNRALNESLKTLEIEPRHFYALWTLGNVFEALNRPDDALEAYREANRIYPELKAVKDRLQQLEIEIGGTVL